MTLVTTHIVSDTGHTSDHNAICVQVNQNTTDIATNTAAATANTAAIIANKGLPAALTGATQPTRYVGRWAATGAPASGTFAVGDFGFDGANTVQICTVAGTPGTWAPSAASLPSQTGKAGGALVTDGSAARWALAVLQAPVASGDTTGATDTAAIQALLDQAFTAGGGTVQLQPAPPSAPYYTTQIKLRTGVALVGVSRLGTVLRAPLGTTLDMVVLNDNTTNCWKIQSLTLDGQNGGDVTGPPVTPLQSNSFNGIVVNLSIGGNIFSPYQQAMDGLVDNLLITQVTNCGAVAGQGTSEIRWRDVYSVTNGVAGFKLTFADAHYTDCTAGANGEIGFWIISSVETLVNCRAWWNGKTNNAPAGTQISDFFLGSQAHAITLENCSAGDSWGSGFAIHGTQCRINGVVAGGKLQNVLLGAEATDCSIELISHTQINNSAPAHQLNNVGGAVGCQITILGAGAETGTTLTGASLAGNDVTIYRQHSPQTIAYAATVTPDPYVGGKITVGTLTGAVTVANPTHSHAGCEITVTLTQDSTGSRAVTWGNLYVLTSGAIRTDPSSTTTIAFRFDGTNWNETSRTVVALRPGQATRLIVAVGEWFGPAGVTASFAFGNGTFALQQVDLPEDATISKMACHIGTGGAAGSVLRYGIYKDADGDGKPDTLVLDAGTVDGTVVGAGILTLGTPKLLPRGTYWVCAVPQGAPATNPTLTFMTTPNVTQARSSNAGAPPAGDRTYGYSVGAGATGALPASITVTGGGSNNPPLVDMFRSA